VPRRFVLKIGDHLENAETKKYYTERNFAEVAPQYDFITRVLSFGRDAAWKRTLISLLPSHESPVCVDLACGTGDIAFLLAGKYPRGRIAGVDITEPMLDIARQRNTHPNVTFSNQRSKTVRRGGIPRFLQTGRKDPTEDGILGSEDMDRTVGHNSAPQS